MTIRVSITPGPLGPAESLQHAGAGAVVAFEGVVRPEEGETPIAGLEYQAYQPMAEEQLERLAEAILQRHALLAVAVQHSRGFVQVNGVSFRLVIASRHRRAALEAMGWFIDEMKRDVPIWKRARPLA